MLGPTAQFVALACHFNGRALGLWPSSFLLANSTAQFCERIQFLRRQADQWTITAYTPNEWLDHEARPERRAYIVHRRTENPRHPDRESAIFVGGGGRWQLALLEDGRMDVWEAGWKGGNPKAPEHRVWQVTYALVAGNVSSALPELPSPEAIIPRFQETLAKMLKFCKRHQMSAFAECFLKASECLTADDPFALVYHRDLAPDGLLSLSAKRVLAACQAAWVFGGMGSWNDIGFKGEEQQLYEELSEGLFTLLNDAISVGANSAALRRE
jgi:hypothetical protein